MPEQNGNNGNDFGKRLKYYIERCRAEGWYSSYSDFADRALNVSPQSLNKLLNDNQDIRKSTIEKLIEVTNLPADYWFGLVEFPEDYFKTQKAS